jgi:hypothetical protein
MFLPLETRAALAKNGANHPQARAKDRSKIGLRFRDCPEQRDPIFDISAFANFVTRREATRETRQVSFNRSRRAHTWAYTLV